MPKEVRKAERKPSLRSTNGEPAERVEMMCRTGFFACHQRSSGLIVYIRRGFVVRRIMDRVRILFLLLVLY